VSENLSGRAGTSLPQSEGVSECVLRLQRSCCLSRATLLKPRSEREKTVFTEPVYVCCCCSSGSFRSVCVRT
jgi:hypothetical protein